jgi:hypothetical protein
LTKIPTRTLGQKWNEHYRGTKYHVSADRRVWWEVPETKEKVFATSGFENLLDDLLHLRPTGGSFRAAENAAYVTKNQEDPEHPDDWTPLYVQDVDVPLLFEDLDPLATGLEPGDLWTSFFDGAKYSFLGDKVWWMDPETGMRRRVNEKLPPKVHANLKFFKAEGGSFRITEWAKVIALIPRQPLPPRVEQQYAKLSTRQKNLIAVKTKTTDLLPIYIGEFEGGFTLRPTRKLGEPMSAGDRKDFATFMKGYGLNIESPQDDDIDLPPEFHDERDVE